MGITVAEPLVLVDEPAETLIERGTALAARGARGVICFPGDPLPQAPGQRAQLRTIRDGLDRLGLRHLFLRIPPLVENSPGSRALDRFTEQTDTLARAARWCGARGLWLDLPMTASVFHLDHPMPEQELVRAGRRIYATVARRFPDAELLVYGGPDSAPGPRWRALLEGLVEGSGVADAPRITIVRAVDTIPTRPEDVITAAGGIARMAAGTFSLPNRERWERVGGGCLLLDMDAYLNAAMDRQAIERHFRVARDFALAASDRWTVFRMGLRTGTPATDGPVLRLVSPLRGLTRLGTLEHDPRSPDEPIRAFEREGRLSLLFPEGLTRPLTVSGNYRICASVSLAEGTRAFHLARNGSLTIPSHPGPLLVTGLPGDANLTRAGWTWAVDPPLEAGPRRLNFIASWTNRTGLTRRGELAAVAGPRWSLGAASVSMRAAPGETVTLRRTLQGVARAGDRFSASLLLQEPGLPPVSRTIAVPVFPKQLWHIPLDGPCLPDRVLLEAGSLDTLRLVAAAERSGPVCFDADGRVVWNSMDPGPWLCGPVPLNQEGQTLIALGNRRGEVVIRDTRTGQVLWRVSLDGTPTRMLAAAGENRLIALTDGGICHGITGPEKRWAIDPGMNVTRVAPGLSSEYTLLCGTSGFEGIALLLGPDGTVQWRSSLPGSPVAAVSRENGAWLLGFAEGSVGRLDSQGALTMERPQVSNRRLSDLIPLPGETRSTAIGRSSGLIAVTSRGIEALEASGISREVLKDYRLQRVWHMLETGLLMAGSTDGTLYCLDASGRMVWQDSRAWGAPRWVFARPAGKDRLAVIAAFADGVIRAWDGGPLPSVRK